MRAIAVLLTLGCGVAGADTLRAARGTSLEEVSHVVELHLGDGVATLRVQRSIRNVGKTDDEALLSIELPKGATATGLRILEEGRWHAAVLLERQAAAELYRTSPRGKLPATLLTWMRSGIVHLHAYPVRPGQITTIEYKLTAPTQYWGGRYRFNYPRALPRTNLANPTLAVAPAWASSEILVDGRAVRPRHAIPIATTAYLPPGTTDPSATHAAITVAPEDGIHARYGRIVVSPVRSFGRLEIDVGALSMVPVAPQVVFVVDASHSAGPNLIAAQLATIRAYLTHVPDAEVELVVYNRRAVRLFDAFVPAAQLEKRLAEPAVRAALAPANGSAVDEGAQLAAAALHGRTGERRIVIFTDELVRGSLTTPIATGALAGLAKEVVVHVVAPDDRGEVLLRRDDKRPLSPMATGHHGIFARLWGLGGAAEAKLNAAVLELVRPTRFEQVAVTGGYSVYAPEAGEAGTLREGDGIRVFDNNRTAVPPRVTLTGVLWSDKVTRELDGDAPAFARATSAFVFGEDKYYNLKPGEQRTLAMKARAVTQHTSYVTLAKGTRPSNGIGSLGMRGRSFSPPRVRIGTPSQSDGNPAVDLGSFIDKRRCVALHKPAAGWKVTMLVETTRDEIVDVAHAGNASPFAACLVETIWAARLDHRFIAQRKSFVVELGG